MVSKDKESVMVEDRIAALESRVESLEARFTAAARPESAAARTAASIAPPVPPRPAREPIALEDFLGGRVLAWLGGIAVVAGLAFMLTLAISRGWIGEGARTALAGAISAALLLAGARLRERRVRNDATLAAAAAGVAGLFGTLVVAGQVYSLIPVGLALLGALATGAAATALAVRWNAQVIGWIGLVGALLAPAVLGVGGGGIAFLAVAYAATVAVLTWQRWTALGFTAFALVMPQWAWWLFTAGPSQALTVVTLAVFGALTTAAAVGFELRRRETGLRIAAVVLLVLDAVVLDAAGASLLHPAGLWLAAVAAAHLAVGLGGTRIPRVSHELALVALGLGAILADVAFASLAGGLPLVLGWGASAVGFGFLLRRARTQSDRAFALAGLGGHLLSALLHALVIDASPRMSSGLHLEAIAAVAAVGASAAISGRLSGRFRIALDAVALAALAYATALTLDGAALAAALAGQAIALAALARGDGALGLVRGAVARGAGDAVAAFGALAFAGLALLCALGGLAAPGALIDGLPHPLAALGALLAAAVAFAAASRAPYPEARITPALQALAAVVVLYAASALLITFAGEGGQTGLSVLWAATGFGTLVAGLIADRAPLRRGALALLALTAGKVFVYDLASLDSMARVGSLVGLGLLLLAGGFAWQRARPREVPDLRVAGADAGLPRLR